MQKTTTQQKEQNATSYEDSHTQPSEKSISKILQFAAAYRVKRLQDGHFIEMFLN